MSKKHLGIIAVVSVVVVCTASIGYGMLEDWTVGEWNNYYYFLISIGTQEELYNVTLYLPILMTKEEVSPLMFKIEYPSNWTWNITDTEYGKMLKISADFIPAGGWYIKVNTKPNHVINTQNPVGNEPTLHPRLNDTATEYKSYIYAGYNASPTNKANIYIRMTGSKSRAIRLPYPGTDGRSYDDKVDHTIIGEPQGWYVVNGTLKITR